MPVLIALRARLSSVRRFLTDDAGLAITEYGMLVALVAIILIAIVSIYGSQLASWFATKSGQITTL